MKPKIDNKKLSELRKLAQSLLKTKPENADIENEDVRRLIDELDSFQIEYELQNEDLRQAQQDLERSRRRYADLYDFAPVAYFTINEKGMIREANLTAAEMLKVPRIQLINRPFSDFVFADDLDVYHHQRKISLETRDKQTYDLRLTKNGGEVIHALVEMVLETNEADPPGRLRIMMSDISARKAAEMEKLQQLKDRYRAIVMDQSELICRFDPHGRITFVNDAYCRFFGVNHNDILGTNFLPNIHEHDLPLVREHFKTISLREPVKTIEHRVYLPDGQIAWQQWVGRALFDRNGNVIECQAVGRDITDRKRAEEKLNAELNLRQLFLDALPCVAILVKSFNYEIIAANKVAFAAGVELGTRCYESLAKRKDPCPCCLAEKLWNTGEPQNARFWEHGIYWDTYWIPVDGEMFMQSSFDVTELQKTKEALNRAKEECEQKVIERTAELERSHEQLLHSEKLAAVGSLSASIAHEFNNPLQSIMTIIKGISQYAVLEKKEVELISLALQECKRMASLITNLQDFYRPTTGQIELVDLHAVIDDLLLLSKKDHHTRRISVVKEYADDLPTISAVADQLKQVFLNLLNNAADACEGGGNITVTTKKISWEKVAVFISDTGVGMDPATRHRIFEPFFTTKPALKGTGLGLPVSYGIIKKHGGEIEVKSEKGKGTTFFITLPISLI